MTDQKTLWKISEEFKELDNMLLESYGEITDEYVEALNKITSLLTYKISGCSAYVEKKKGLVSLAKDRIKELQAFVKTNEAQLERFNGYVHDCMTRMKVDRLESGLDCVKIRKPAKRLEITDQNKIPSQYMEIVHEYKFDKRAITNAIKAGEIIEGAQLVDGNISLSWGLTSEKKRGKNESDGSES